MDYNLILALIGIFITIVLGHEKISGLWKWLLTGTIFNQDWTAFHYTWTSKTENVLRKGVWEFKRTIFNEIKLKVSYPGSSRTYTGKVVGTDQHINIILSKDGSKKQIVICRLLNNDAPRIDAVWFGPDDFEVLTTDFWFLTLDHDISEEEAKEYILKRRDDYEGRQLFRNVDIQ